MSAAPSSSPQSPPAHGGTRRIVVVGVDGSANSLAALQVAGAEARRTGGLVRVVGAGTSSVDPLDGYVRDVFGDDMPPDLSLLAAVGEPTEVLLAAAAGADLLVVGARGQSVDASARLGSTAQYCVAHAPCPVLVVPAPADAPVMVGAD
jgi:nucleotide-binding universal stress UspA family protein